MSDTRTDEQKAADANMTKALEESLAAYGLLNISSEDATIDGTPMMLTDYIVLYSLAGFAPDGDTMSPVQWYVRENGIPWYRILGLLRAGTLKVETDYQAAWQEGKED